MTWRKVSLGDVCELRYGKSLVKETRVQDGPYPVYGSSGVVGHHDEFLVDGPCLVVGRKGSIGSVFFSEQPCYPIDTAYFVHCKEEMNLRFLYYQLSTLRLNELNKAAAIPGLNREDAYRKNIVLPPLSIQQRIADTLDTADALRRKDQELLQKYDELAQSIFHEMFGDPVQNEKQWERKPLGELTSTVTYGLTVRPGYLDAGVPLVSARELRNGFVDLLRAPKISQADFEKLSAKCKPGKGDILFSKTGTIGLSAIVETHESFAITQNAARIVFDQELLNLSFALAILRHRSTVQQCVGLSKGNAVKDLQLGDLSKMTLIVPPRSLQVQFAERITALNRLKTLQVLSVEQTSNLFEQQLNTVFSQ